MSDESEFGISIGDRRYVNFGEEIDMRDPQVAERLKALESLISDIERRTGQHFDSVIHINGEYGFAVMPHMNASMPSGLYVGTHGWLKGDLTEVEGILLHEAGHASTRNALAINILQQSTVVTNTLDAIEHIMRTDPHRAHGFLLERFGSLEKADEVIQRIRGIADRTPPQLRELAGKNDREIFQLLQKDPTYLHRIAEAVDTDGILHLMMDDSISFGELTSDLYLQNTELRNKTAEIMRLSGAEATIDDIAPLRSFDQYPAPDDRFFRIKKSLEIYKDAALPLVKATAAAQRAEEYLVDDFAIRHTKDPESYFRSLKVIEHAEVEARQVFSAMAEGYEVDMSSHPLINDRIEFGRVNLAASNTDATPHFLEQEQQQTRQSVPHVADKPAMQNPNAFTNRSNDELRAVIRARAGEVIDKTIPAPDMKLREFIEEFTSELDAQPSDGGRRLNNATRDLFNNPELMDELENIIGPDRQVGFVGHGDRAIALSITDEQGNRQVLRITNADEGAVRQNGLMLEPLAEHRIGNLRVQINEPVVDLQTLSSREFNVMSISEANQLSNELDVDMARTGDVIADKHNGNYSFRRNGQFAIADHGAVSSMSAFRAKLEALPEGTDRTNKLGKLDALLGEVSATQATHQMNVQQRAQRLVQGGMTLENALKQAVTDVNNRYAPEPDTKPSMTVERLAAMPEGGWSPMQQQGAGTGNLMPPEETEAIRERQIALQPEALARVQTVTATHGLPDIAMQPEAPAPILQLMAEQQQQSGKAVERRAPDSPMRMKPQPVEPSMLDASDDVPDDRKLRDGFGHVLKTDPRTGKPMDRILESRTKHYAELAENDVILGRKQPELEPAKTLPVAEAEPPAKKRAGLHQLVANGSDASWRELEGHFERIDAKHPVPANDQQMGFVGDAPKPEAAPVKPDTQGTFSKALWAARDTKFGKGVGVATVGTNAAAALKAASEGNMDEAGQYAGVAVINAASEAAFSDTGAKLTMKATEAMGNRIGMRATVAGIKAAGGKIPVVGAFVGAAFGIGETGYEIYEAFNGRSNWRRVSGTFASGVAGTVGGLLGFGAGEALQEGVHFGTKSMWGEKDAARHSGTGELVALGSELLGSGNDDDWRTKQAKAAIAKQKAKAATSGSVHSNFAGRGGALNLLEELQDLTGQMAKGGWGRYVGNGDGNPTAQELRQEMSEHGITIAELDRNKDGQITGRELTDTYIAHGVNRHPVKPKTAAPAAPVGDWRAEQAAAAKKRQAEAAASSGSVHSSFAGRAGGAHLNKELGQIDAQMDRTNWGKFIGNGDANVTVAEMRETMVKYDIKISEIDKNKDGNIGGREFTDALTAHGVNRNPVRGGR